MARDEQGGQTEETIIAAGVKVEGDLVSEGDIRVDGMVTGKIKTNKNLYIGKQAEVEADIEAENADLAGLVKGQINISSSLALRDTARVNGDISCVRLSVSEGAFFSGNCAMDNSQAEVLPTDEEEVE